MSGHDDDIDFDFFGEPEPEPPKRRLVRRPAGPPPGGPPPRRPGAPAPPATPIVRLVGLIVFAIAVILILVFAVRSCETSNKTAAYRSYMDQVTKIAADSQAVGKRLNAMLADQNLTEVKLETQLKGLIGEQDIVIRNASKLTPPGPLRQQQAKMIEALQLRSDALNGLLTVFRATYNKHGITEIAKSGLLLSAQMYKAVASDVLWTDMFIAQTRAVLQKEGVAGVSPPSSVFLADPDQATRGAMGAVWQKIHGIQSSTTSSGAGQHGTGIAYLKIAPSGQTLYPNSTATVIKLISNLTFVVGVKNTGDFLEQNVKVTLVITQAAPNKPITKYEVIPQIYNGVTQPVDFRGPFNVATMITPVKIKVDVAPVTGEANLSNNSYTYNVIFSF
jgi:hypothetical protein